jgi:hypothetical protein
MLIAVQVVHSVVVKVRIHVALELKVRLQDCCLLICLVSDQPCSVYTPLE